MTNDQKIWVGVALLAALGGAVYVQKKRDDKVGSAETTSAQLPEIKAPEEPDRVSITNGAKGEIVLEKKGEGWRLAKPVSAEANEQNVKSLLDNLKDLKIKEAIVQTATDDNKKSFDFEADKAVHLVVWKGEEKKLDLTFGKSGARGQMVMVDGQPGIYSATGYSSYVYAREAKGWRNTEIFKFDDANATSVAIENTRGKFSFTKGDKWAGTFKGAAIARFDEEKLKELLRSLKGLHADDFGDGKTLAETGLDKPEATVTVDLKDGAGKYVLKIGKNSSGSSRWAIKDGSDIIFSISDYVSGFGLADKDKFEKSPDAGAPPPAMPSMPGMPGMPGMHGGADDEH